MTEDIRDNAADVVVRLKREIERDRDRLYRRLAEPQTEPPAVAGAKTRVTGRVYQVFLSAGEI